MKKLLVVGVALLGVGCALEVEAPQPMENVGAIEQGVVTRTKAVSFLPARMCDGVKKDIDAWNWSCFADYRHTEACTAVLKPRPWPAGPRWTYVGSDGALYFTPAGGSSWHAVDDEISLANVDDVACYNAGKSSEHPVVHYGPGHPPGRRGLSIDTIFEHIRSVTVRATATVVLGPRKDPAYSDTLQVAVQTQNSAGAWVDRAVRGSAYVRIDSHEVTGEVKQTLTTSVKVPANQPVRMLMRTGPGAVNGSDVGFSLLDAELRGEECVPANDGGCL
jgi:hypothetical protein